MMLTTLASSAGATSVLRVMAATRGWGERTANAPGLFLGLSAPLRDFCCPSVPFLDGRAQARPCEKATFHGVFRPPGQAFENAAPGHPTQPLSPETFPPPHSADRKEAPHAHARRKARNVPQAPRAGMLRHPQPLGRGLGALSARPRIQGARHDQLGLRLHAGSP